MPLIEHISKGVDLKDEPLNAFVSWAVGNGKMSSEPKEGEESFLFLEGCIEEAGTDLEKVVRDTVSGQDTVLSSTSQPVFNNQTNNTLNPQAVVGETIFVKIKMENIFNTPLQLRKAYLLWKFVPDDSEGWSTVSRLSSLTRSRLTTRSEGSRSW